MSITFTARRAFPSVSQSRDDQGRTGRGPRNEEKRNAETGGETTRNTSERERKRERGREKKDSRALVKERKMRKERKMKQTVRNRDGANRRKEKRRAGVPVDRHSFTFKLLEALAR